MMRLLMRVSFARTANPAALLALVVSLLSAPPSGADPLAPAESAWAPSFTFLSASSASAPAAGGSPEAIPAPAAAELPVCTSAIADDCITTVFEESTRPEVPTPSSVTAVGATPHPPPTGAGSTGAVVVAARDPAAGVPATVARAQVKRTAEPVEKRDETELWVPSLSFFGAALIQEADSAVSSRPLYDPAGLSDIDQGLLCPPDDPIDCIRPSASGSDRQVTPLVAASLELMSPSLQGLVGRPRAFAHADAAVSFSRTRNIAREGVPGDVAQPAGAPFFNEPQAINGQGSQTSSYVKSLILTGGLGVAFSVDVGERRLRIKPSAEFLREKVQVDGEVIRVVATDPAPPGQTRPACGGDDLNGCRVIELTDSQDKPFYGIGPGMEIEMDAARAGPLVFSVYSAFAAYRMLGDLDINLSDTQLADPDDPDSAENAAWRYEKDPWSFRVGVGMRFRYAPED